MRRQTTNIGEANSSNGATDVGMNTSVYKFTCNCENNYKNGKRQMSIVYCSIEIMYTIGGKEDPVEETNP